MPRVLALDVGERRIGLATGSTEAGFAAPAGVLHRRGRDQDLAAVTAIVMREQAGIVVAGVPLGPDNRPGDQAASVLRFLRRLQVRIKIPLVLVDEAGSTREAGERYPSQPVDAAAAAVILERYMEGRHILDPGLLA